MTNPLSNPLQNPLQSSGTQSSGVYRPKYRTRLANPTYALDGKARVREFDDSGIMDPFKALEEWREKEERRGNQGATRWHPDKTRALYIYIAPSLDPEWNEIILKAFRDWEASASGLIQIFITVRPEQADIRVEWSEQAVPGRDYEVGHTKCTVQSQNWITQATITLLAEPEIDKHLSQQQVYQRLYTTALHEFGHALGLEHSKNAKDVMHHQGWRNSQLSANDINRFQELYSKSSSMSLVI